MMRVNALPLHGAHQTGIEEDRMQNNSQNNGSKKALIAATIALVAIVAVAAAFFLGGQSAPERTRSTSQEVQEYGFKAYNKNEAEQQKPQKSDDSGVPDEFDELAAKYGDQEVVVIEEYHEPEVEEEIPQPAATAQIVELDEEAKYEPGQARPVNQETKTIADYQRQRYGSKEQQRLLRQFNEQLDRGERPVIPKARIPGQLRAFSPQVNRELKVNPSSRFIPGKLHQPNAKIKALPKTMQTME